METNVVLQEKILALTFNYERSSIIYLSQPAQLGENPVNELIELDLHNQTVLERYIVSSQLPNQPPFTLLTSKRNGLLIMTFQPSIMEVWRLGNSAQGFKQSIWTGETKGKRGYEIQLADVSNLDGTMFFSALNQRNIYCANIDDAIQSNSPQLNTSKLKLPVAIRVNDLKCHPHEQKVLAACSDHTLKIWNSNTFTELTGIQTDSNVCTLSFQLDGQKLLTGCEDGKIFCWDGKTLGNRNILLAVYKNTEPVGILCLSWLNYNGSQNTEDFLCYASDGAIKLMNLKLQVPQEMIRDQKVNKAKQQEFFGTLKEVSTIMKMSNKGLTEQQIQQLKVNNIGVNKFIQVHPYANFITLNSFKLVTDSQVYVGQSFYQFNTFILLLNNSNNLLSEYPVCCPFYSCSLGEILPQTDNRILTQRYLYFLDQHTQEIKQYCLAKGSLRTIGNLKNFIEENPICYSLAVRPNNPRYSRNILFLIEYKRQTSFKSQTLMFDQETGIFSNDIKEYPSRISIFLGQESWANPPLFFLYEDRQSYSIKFEDSLPKDDQMLEIMSNFDKEKLFGSMKQSLNLKVFRIFRTPLRYGFVVLYQPMNENVLRFSRNRNQENHLTDMLMQSSQEMVFRLPADDNITDVAWQKNDVSIGAVVTISKVYIINDVLSTLKVISLQPQISYNNRVLLTYWLAHTLIIQTKFHILYTLLNGKCGSIQSIDSYEDKNLLAALLWDRALLLSSNHQKKGQIEIKTKYINMIQPVLQGYIHNQVFLSQEIDEKVIVTSLQTFGNQNLDFSLVQDLEEVNQRACSKFVIQMDDCKQFSQNERLKYYISILDDQNILETLFGSTGIVGNFDLQKQLIKKISDPRFAFLRELLTIAQDYFVNSYQYRTAAAINAILTDSPNLIINILAKQNRMGALQQVNSVDEKEQKLFSLLAKQKPMNSQVKTLSQDICLSLAEQVSGSSSSFFIENITQFIQKLEEQQAMIKSKLDNDANFQMQPIYYMTDYLLDKLKQIQADRNRKPLAKCNVGFGEEKYHLVYEDIPREDDEDEHIKDGKIIRYFDKLPYDSIVYYLGVGGQPQAKSVPYKNEAQGGGARKASEPQEEEQDYGDDYEGKEFQDLLLYWRVDEGKGGYLEDLGNNDCCADIYVNGEVSTETEQYWEKLEDYEPMEQEDKWGKKLDAQCSFQLQTGVGFQSRKKNYWKGRKLDFFSIELWIKPQSGDGQFFEVGEGDLALFLESEILQVKAKQSKLKFTAEPNEDSVTQPQLRLDQWNHICVCYEAARNQISIYLNAKHQFCSQEVELAYNIFKDKFVVFGQTKRYVDVLKCQVTEFRFWRQKFSLNEIRDGYRTPLAVVYEKKKQIKMKFKGKAEQKNKNLSQFVGFLEQPDQVESTKLPQSQEKIEQPIEGEKMPENESKPDIMKEFTEFGSTTSGFQEFGQSVTNSQQSNAFESDFFSSNDFGPGWGQAAQTQQTQSQQIKPPTPKGDSSSPNLQSQQYKEIQGLLDRALEDFTNARSASGIENLNKTFDKMNEIVKGSAEKLKKFHQFIIQCAHYRYAFQLLIGIEQMRNQNNKKKELLMYLIIIYLNLKPNHLIKLILQTIEKCIEFDNTLLAESLTSQLKPSLSKVQIAQSQNQKFEELQAKITSIKDKNNLCLMRMTCPYCQKHFHFKGQKKCSKCQNEFALCTLTLSCIPKDKRLNCKVCCFSFSLSAKKAGDQCPICRLSQLS